jgi:hypothetical protein
MWRTPDPERFIIGVNLPWVGYGTDVGASAWFPEGGISRQPSARDTLDRAFAVLARDGIPLARVFLLCDARSGVVFDAAGFPRGIDQAVLPDIDALLDAARRHGIGLLPVLFDFHFCGPQQTINGVQLGGRSRVLIDPGARTALIETVIRPIVERYATDPAVIAWDVMNEPEWCLGGGLFSKRPAVPFVALQHFLGEAAQRIRELATQPVTVGCAGTWALDLVTPIGLDFYQVHWYDRFGWPALARPVAGHGLLDRPVILGEFSGRSPRIADVLVTAKQAGYEAALVWSVLAQDEYSGYPAEFSRNAP